MSVIHVERPFTVNALEQALVASGVITGQENLTEDVVLSSCAGLVRIEHISNPRR